MSLRCSIPCYVLLCSSMLCYVVPCYVILSSAMLCYIMVYTTQLVSAIFICWPSYTLFHPRVFSLHPKTAAATHTCKHWYIYGTSFCSPGDIHIHMYVHMHVLMYVCGWPPGCHTIDILLAGNFVNLPVAHWTSAVSYPNHTHTLFVLLRIVLVLVVVALVLAIILPFLKRHCLPITLQRNWISLPILSWVLFFLCMYI